ncbi:hypothetical protein MMC14_009251 [Varicellaria rhodocarpa]|nr:hypothetical protein [Varicellaria rhodocarpa]
MAPPTFLTLPLEIRFQIYEEVFPLSRKCDNSGELCVGARWGQTALCGVCPQMDLEVATLYYARHHVHVTFEANKIYCDIPVDIPDLKRKSEYDYEGRSVFRCGRRFRIDQYYPEDYPEVLKHCKSVIITDQPYRRKIRQPGIRMNRRPKIPPLNLTLLEEFLWNISTRQLKLELLWSPPDAPGKDAMESQYGEVLREILEEVPGLQEYCAVNRRGAIFACKGKSWGEEWWITRVLCAEQERCDFRL